MDLKARVEVHFYDMEELAVYFETPHTGRDEGFAGLVLCAFYTMRQAANLGGNDGRVVGLALEAWCGNLFNFIKTENGSPTMPRPQVVPFRGPGRYSFEAHCQFPEPLEFKLKPHGFGFLGRGLGHYAPTSVMGFCNFLADRYRTSFDLLLRLAVLTRASAVRLQTGQVGVLNQYQAVTECLDAVWAVGEASES